MKRYLFPFLIVCAGGIAYANMIGNGFVWDDTGFVYYSPFTRPLYSLVDVFTLRGQPVYRPLFFLYLDLIAIISQGLPSVMHALSLLLHVASGIVLFLLLKSRLSALLAFVLSVIFMVHPINVESVSYIAAASDIIVFLFGLLALRQKNIIMTGVFLLMALLSNEAGLSWILIAAAYLWMNGKLHLKQLPVLAVPLALYAALHAMFSQATFYHFGYVPIFKLTLWERLLTTPKVFFYYLTTVVYPAYLAIGQYWIVTKTTLRDFYLPLFVDSIFLIASISYGVYLYRKHKKYFKTYIFFSVWFFAGIAPYLQIIALDMTVADRWFYTPFAGLLGMIGVVLETIKPTRLSKIIGIVAAVVIITALTARTIVRNGNWKNGLTLYAHDLKLNPDRFDLHEKLAQELMKVKRFDEAMREAKTAISLKPDDISNLGTLSILYIQTGEPDKAIPNLRKLVSLQPNNYPGVTNLIYAYLLVEDYENAETYARAGLIHYPNDQSLLVFLQMAESKTPVN